MNLKIKVSIKIICTFTALFLCSQLYANTPRVTLQGLFKNSAVLVINGKVSVLKVGATSREGVSLVSANKQQAIIDIAGTQQTLEIKRDVGTGLRKPEFAEVRLTSQEHGHYWGSAKFNGRSANFLIDTGASAISMSSNQAKQLGIQYNNAPTIRVSTANGVVNGYTVTLNSVVLGSIKLNLIDAVIVEGSFPSTILMGNSFLSHLDIKVESGVMVLKNKF